MSTAFRAQSLFRRVRASARVALETWRDPLWSVEPASPASHVNADPDSGFVRVPVPQLPSLRVPKRSHGDVNMLDTQLAFVEWAARHVRPSRFLEVGAYFGVTSCLLAQIAPLVVVEWFKGNREAGAGPWRSLPTDEKRRETGFFSNLEAAGLRDRITVLAGDSHLILPTLRYERFTLALVDADHSYESALADIEDVWEVLEPGGILLLDDYSSIIVGGRETSDVRAAWRSFARNRGLPPLPLYTSQHESDRPKTVAVLKPVNG